MEINFPKLEQKILEFWQKNQIFEKSISQRKKARDFVFYEGPPTANGKPGIHHVIARVFKDIICRYKTMQGFRVLRKAGWDTHGLPVELEIEKKLGLKNKKDIEKYGIAEFNKKCKESVWQYKDEWEKLTKRIGYWLDMKSPYITYKNDYIEKVWEVIKQIFQKGLLYKDYKVVPYCPRCGTSLSSHEVAQGYEKVKDPSIYVKFRIKGSNKRCLLVWTTTPWTLPGNVAIAVNPKITYVEVKSGNDILIIAKERLGVLHGDYRTIKKEFSGKDLLGLEYEPSYINKLDKKAYFVIPGDFVSLEEGTGLVHIAPAFGEDDMEVGKKNDLPILLNVDGEGKFKKEVENWAGMFVKDADRLIIKNLQNRDLLFLEESYEHDYPFCWRCNSPLLYYAKESWFINMQKVKKQLIANNQKINWVPVHLKEGRFGEWLREVKDWAISRERYWGTPLPIWQCQKCGQKEVIGSLPDLLSQKFTDNKYFILRHGESLCQTKYKKLVIGCKNSLTNYALTKNGEKGIKKIAEFLKKEKIDLIYSSDFLRTAQTAKIVAKEIGVKITFDKQLRDIYWGVYDGGEKEKFYRDYPDPLERFKKNPPKGENWNGCQKRIVDFIKKIDKKYREKKILIVSHGDPLWLLEGAMKGLTDIELWEQKIEDKRIKVGELRKIDFKILPLNQEGELDFHRPYIDEVKFQCHAYRQAGPKCQGTMARTPELIDVWFDSGSMPFASDVAAFPADYICEAIDQTRGWFYTLLAIATLLGRSAPYKNVISTGHVLDEKGEKMSKSKGNVVDPWQIIEKYGADAGRWYFYTVNQPGDAKLFTEKDVDQALKKFILTFWNSFLFFNTYRDQKTVKHRASNSVLDKWIISRLNGLIQDTTEKLDKYDVTGAARAIEDFVINNLSLWYIRRSRKRFQEAAPTLRFVLLTLSKLTAPFIPFLSEEIYRSLAENSSPRSVHLGDWPKADKKLINEKLNQEMKEVRETVTLALAERAKAGIKVRQPLRKLEIVEKISEELAQLIKDEVNVKEIAFGKNFKLDTEITPELKEEGTVRETIRQIQEMRKKAGLKPKDKISIEYFGTPESNEVLGRNKAFILKETKAKDFRLLSKPKVEQKDLQIVIKKI